MTTTVSHISYSRLRPVVSLTPSGRIKMSLGDTAVSFDESVIEDLVRDLESAKARLAVFALRAESVLAD